MDNYIKIETKIAKKYGVVAKGTKKSIGDFLLNNSINLPVNVKSTNLDKKNYSPNIISAKRLIKWITKDDKHQLYFIFVDYTKTSQGLIIKEVSGLIPFEHLSWNCLTIEAQGWGVIQKSKPLEVNKEQTREQFFRGLKNAYEIFMNKEAKKMKQIEEMIKRF